LSGVSQPSLGIDEGSRTVQGVASLLDNMGLTAASQYDYDQWVFSKKSALNLSFANFGTGV
jgi:hypothetical protein